MIRRPPRSTQSRSSASSDVYKRQVSAASAAGERTEVAREIMMAAEAGVPLHRIGVIVRQSTAKSSTLSRELTRLGIPNFEYAAKSCATSAVGRAIRLWWDLEEEDFPRESVLDVLDLLGDEPGRDRVVSARSLAGRAGIVRGARAWAERLAALASAPRSEADGHAVRMFAAECDRLIASAADWPRAPRPWNDWADEISWRL